jgi:hypothetical protein
MIILVIELLLLATAVMISFLGIEINRLDYFMACSLASFGYSYFAVVKQGWYPDYLRRLFTKLKLDNTPHGVFYGLDIVDGGLQWVKINDSLKAWLNVLLFCPYCATFRIFFYVSVATNFINNNLLLNLIISFPVSLAFGAIADIIFSKLDIAPMPDDNE